MTSGITSVELPSADGDDGSMRMWTYTRTGRWGGPQSGMIRLPGHLSRAHVVYLLEERDEGRVREGREAVLRQAVDESWSPDRTKAALALHAHLYGDAPEFILLE